MLLLAQSAAESAGTSVTAETILFWIFSVVAVGAGIAVVTMRNIVHAAMMLVVNLLSIAGLYLGLQSGFLSIVQVIVYAGAIMVLFLFVIMLLGVDRDDLLTETSVLRTSGAVLVGAVLAAGLLFVLGTSSLTTASACGDAATANDGTQLTCVGLDEALAEEEQGSVGFLANSLFRDYGFPFEASALLLVVATLGALVLGRRKDPALDDEGTPSAPVPDEDDLERLLASQPGPAAAQGLSPYEAGEPAARLGDIDDPPPGTIAGDATAALADAEGREAPDGVVGPLGSRADDTAHDVPDDTPADAPEVSDDAPADAVDAPDGPAADSSTDVPSEAPGDEAPGQDEEDR